MKYGSIRWGLRAKVGILATLPVCLTVLIFQHLIFERLDEETLKRRAGVLQTEASLVSALIEAQIESVEKDVRVLAGSSAINGIIRAQEAGGVDPFDQSTEREWQERLTEVFTQFLTHKDSVLQVRLIGKADEGRELVRVNQQNEGLQVTPEDELQQKGQTEYFQKAQRFEEGTVFFSAFNLNREYGEIEQPYRPVVRASTPIYDSENEFFGIVVVNIEADRIFGEVSKMVCADHEIMVTNLDGDYLFHPDSSKTYQFEFGRNERINADFPGWIPAFSVDSPQQGAGMTERAEGKMAAGSWQRLKYGNAQEHSWLTVAITERVQQVLEGANSVRRASLLLLAGLLLVTTILGLAVASWISRPFRKVRVAMDRYRQGDGLPDDLPQGRDEAGQMAHSFYLLTKELDVKTDRLNAKNDELQSFVFGASHDLQEPLRTMKTFTAHFEKQYGGQLDAKAGQILGFMSGAAGRMEELLRALLAFSSVQDEAELEKVEVKSSDLLDDVLIDLEASIQSKEAKVLHHALPTVFGEPVQMRQIFQNLVGNALKFSDPDRRHVVSISAKDADEFWRFEIKDNGIGIDPEFHERIFVMFQRLHRSDEYKGTGIGLATCKRIAESHGGAIGVDSIPGEGATFWFTIAK